MGIKVTGVVKEIVNRVVLSSSSYYCYEDMIVNDLGMEMPAWKVVD